MEDLNLLEESKIESNFYPDEYELLDALNYLKTNFKPLVFNNNILTYFGIDTLWQLTKYK